MHKHFVQVDMQETMFILRCWNESVGSHCHKLGLHHKLGTLLRLSHSLRLISYFGLRRIRKSIHKLQYWWLFWRLANTSILNWMGCTCKKEMIKWHNSCSFAPFVEILSLPRGGTCYFVGSCCGWSSRGQIRKRIFCYQPI